MSNRDFQNDANERENSKKDDFISLLLSNQRRIFTYILFFVPNRSDAEDLMQETASWMWKNFDEYKPGTNFGAWGVQVARYKILKLKQRTFNSRLKFEGDLIELIDAKSEAALEGASTKISALRKCLTDLNDQDRRLIFLRYEKGLATKQLAELVGRPVHGLYKSMARIHKMLLNCVRHTLALQGGE